MRNFILSLYKYLVGAGAGTAVGGLIGLFILPFGFLWLLCVACIGIGSYISYSVYKDVYCVN